MKQLLEHTGGAGVAGAAAIVLLLGLSLTGIRTANGEFREVTEIDAVFDAIGQGVDDFSDVRLRGVPIGEVAGIELDDRGRAVVALEIDPEHQLPRGTTASIEALSIFGPKFVRLDPDAAAPDAPLLGDGDVIEATTGPTELQVAIDSLDELLDAIDPEQLGTVLSVSARTLEEMAASADGFLDGSEALLDVAADRTDEGVQLLADLERITAELDGTGERLTRIAGDANATLPELTARAEQIAALLEGSTRTANEVSGLLEDHPRAASDLPNGLVGAAFPPLALSTGNLDTTPDIVDMLGEFFGTLGDVLHVDGDGKQLAAIEFYIELSEACSQSTRPICEGRP